MDKIVLLGAGGHAKVVIDLLQRSGKYEIVGITDNSTMQVVLGVPVIGTDDILRQLYEDGVTHAFICVGGLNCMDLRQRLFEQCRGIGFQLPVLIHDRAVVSEYASVNDGTCVMAGAVINAGVQIGRNCIINTSSIIEHDCVIGDNTHVSPGACIAGGVRVGTGAHIGAGSTIIQALEIGSNVTIGAGATVINDIKDNALAVGVPAKVIRWKE